jgi:FkbM family methyltransferase
LVQVAGRANRSPAEFFDVGAHVGMHSLLAATVYGPSVHVTGFEPTPLTASIFRSLAAANQLPIRIEQCAVAGEDGTAELYISPWDLSNSLAEGFRPATDSFFVPTVSVDSYCEAHGVRPDVVKIDVETLESQVLLGARASLERSHASIVCELLPAADPEKTQAALGALEDLGYHLHRFVRDDGWLRCSAQDIVDQVPHDGRDWLFTPGPLDDEFRAAWHEWGSAIAECTSESTMPASRNSRRPPARYQSTVQDEVAGPMRRLSDRIAQLTGRAACGA